MRGGPLSHADIAGALQPFIVACWNGRSTEEMPADVREAWLAANPGGRNISCMIFDPKGKLVSSFWPIPDTFEVESLVRFMKGKIAAAGLGKPGPKREVRLPAAEGPGVRVILKLREARGGKIFNYRAPVVETMKVEEGEKKALRYPETAREVPAADLRRWLEQFYPPAIMDSSGEVPKLEGTLTLTAAGKRQAILKGEVRFQLDDRAATKYKGTLEAIVTYGENGPDYTSFRAAFEGMYPKSDAKHNRAMEFKMTGLIESTPE